MKYNLRHKLYLETIFKNICLKYMASAELPDSYYE